MSESDDPFMCLLSDENDEEQVCAINFDDGVDECDDELIADTYRGLRDVDGWQHRDPWGGSAGDVPRRLTHTSTSTLISAPLSISSSSYTLSAQTGLSKTSVITESGQVPLSTDEPGKGETHVAFTTATGMSESDLLALEA